MKEVEMRQKELAQALEAGGHALLREGDGRNALVLLSRALVERGAAEPRLFTADRLPEPQSLDAWRERA